MLSREMWILVRKELLQVRRNRGALLSATLLPLMLMVLVPLSQLFSMRLAGGSTRPLLPEGIVMPAGLLELAEPQQLFTRILLPMFVTMSGLVVPSIAASYTVVAERERRTLDLLMALPVRVHDIVLAKLVATMVMAGVVVLPLFMLDAAVVLSMGVAGPGYVVQLLVLLLCALACSAGLALLLALLARDFRTANNINGALSGPLVVLTGLTLFLLPGGISQLVLAALLLLVGGTALAVGLRWLTFERYLA